MAELTGLQLREALVAVLAESPLLRMLGHGGAFSSELRKLLDEARLLRFGQGQNIIREGAACDGLYILVDGRLDVLKENKLVGAITQPGEVFGEVGIIGGSHRTATVRAATDAQCLKTGAGLSRRLDAKENALFAQAMQHALAQVMLRRMNAINEEVGELRTQIQRRDREIMGLKAKTSHLEERIAGLVKERNEGFHARRKLRSDGEE